MPRVDVSVATMKVGEHAHVVTVEGELDLYTSPRLAAELEALATDEVEVVLDLSGVSFMDSTALGSILAAARRLRLEGGRLAVVCTSGTARRLLTLVGLDRVLPVYDTADRALEHMLGSVVLRRLERA